MKRREFDLKVLKLVEAGGLAAQWLDAGRMAATPGRAEVRIKRLMPCFTVRKVQPNSTAGPSIVMGNLRYSAERPKS